MKKEKRERKRGKHVGVNWVFGKRNLYQFLGVETGCVFFLKERERKEEEKEGKGERNRKKKLK